VSADEALRQEYLAAIEQEISEGKARLAKARAQIDDARARGLAVSDFTLDWLVSERDRLRAGGEFDEAAARRFLAERR
jgi:hypothetical protein